MSTIYVNWETKDCRPVSETSSPETAKKQPVDVIPPVETNDTDIIIHTASIRAEALDYIIEAIYSGKYHATIGDNIYQSECADVLSDLLGALNVLSAVQKTKAEKQQRYELYQELKKEFS